MSARAKEQARARISLVVATDHNGVIGYRGRLPWHIPEELRWFKQLTWGHPILMGRVTHKAIGRLLPGRENLVLSRDANVSLAPGARRFASLDEALAAVAQADEVMVIGGAEVFAHSLPIADRIYRTVIAQPFKGDTWFPALDDTWTVTHMRPLECSAPFEVTVQTLERSDRT